MTSRRPPSRLLCFLFSAVSSVHRLRWGGAGPGDGRTEGNTLDLRGMTMDEAEDALDAFISRQVLGGAHGGYVLHGHGTGVLKAGVRRVSP